jgi:hypothetical protein
MSRSHIQHRDDNEVFICGHCGLTVPLPEGGTAHRNHCPRCLWSRHVDLKTGDRMSVCRGMMEPAGIWVRRRDEWALIHRCVKCGAFRANRIAGDDDEALLFSLALRPLLQLPFPAELALERLVPGRGGRMS